MVIAAAAKQSIVVFNQVIDEPALGDVLRMTVITRVKIKTPSAVPYVLHHVSHG